MSWMFETESDYQDKLDWVAEFVRHEIEPLDHVVEHAWDVRNPVRNRLVRPLQQRVKDQHLWACHLGPEFGGPGYGQLKLALLNEQIGHTHSGPVVFGCQAPDSGNAEILAKFGSVQLKERYLEPLLDNEIVSAYSMTEPTGGSDPTSFRTRAHRDGDEWVLNGEKWFSSHANFASFLIVMAVTDRDAPPHERLSMFVVPSDTPGVTVERHVGVYGHGESEGTHTYLRYDDVRIPVDHMLGELGQGFRVGQIRLGGGRIHHAMRTVGLVRRSLDMMLERAVSRTSGGRPLGERQLVQEMIADSYIQLEQFRLLVLQAAWRIDRHQDYRKVIVDIAAVKAAMPQVLRDVAGRAIQIHGSLGISDEMPFGKWVLESHQMGLVDGATEVHKVQLADRLMRGVQPAPGLFPTGHLPSLRAAARAHFADRLDDEATSAERQAATR